MPVHPGIPLVLQCGVAPLMVKRFLTLVEALRLFAAGAECKL
jgi:hypothetical protein